MSEYFPREQEMGQESERMKAFRIRKEKELQRRARIRHMEQVVLGLVIIALTAGLIALVVNLAKNGGPASFELVTETPEPPAETEPETEATTPEPTTEATTPEPTTRPPDPRLDVLTHYNNMFIASKVNTHLNIRESYPDGMIIGKLTKYSGGEILEDLGNGWWKIRSGDIEGYIAGEYCVVGEEAHRLALEHCIQMVAVTAEKLNVRSGPGFEYDIWTTLNNDERQVVQGKEGNWLKIAFNSTFGYISADYVRTGFYLVEAVPWSSLANASPRRRALLEYAQQFIGTPYLYGGTSLTGGIDCSSFVQQCYKNAAGVSLDRTSRMQVKHGTAVALADAKPGDLLFYADASGTIDHVAMYLGDGKIIHAALSLGQVTISKYNYATQPVAVRNILGE